MWLDWCFQIEVYGAASARSGERRTRWRGLIVSAETCKYLDCADVRVSASTCNTAVVRNVKHNGIHNAPKAERLRLPDAGML